MNDIYDKKCKKSVLARISSGSSFTNEIKFLWNIENCCPVKYLYIFYMITHNR